MSEADEVREIAVGQVLFSMEDKEDLIALVKELASFMSSSDVPIDDGIAAMMMLAHSHISTLPDEVVPNVVAQCVAVMTGNYSFEGDLH